MAMSEQQQTGLIYIYIVRGTHNHLHIATATNVTEKLKAINSGDGPISLRPYTPVELVYVRCFSDHRQAHKVLTTLKGYTRERKERLIAQFLQEWHAGETTIEQACAISERIPYPPVRQTEQE
jgi:predicted GIY-YIG superfamily endonuclease